jgi:hypothetical protein
LIHASRPAATLASFVLRIWPEQDGQTFAWRGEVVHLQSGTRRPFVDLADVAAFLHRTVGPAFLKDADMQSAGRSPALPGVVGTRGERATSLFVLRPLAGQSTDVRAPACEIIHLASRRQRTVQSLADLASFLDACLGGPAFSAASRNADTAQ